MPPKKRPAAAPQVSNEAGLDELEAGVLEFCREVPDGATQENLSERFPDVSAEELMKALNELVKRSLLEFLQRGSQPLFRPINVDVADKLSSLDGEERMIYNVIRESDNEGVWTKIIKNKTNLHQNVVTKCIKSLTHKGFIKAVKSVKAGPTRKVYMLAEITPSHETTGGVWFTDSELDTEFVNRLCSKALQCVAKASTPPSPQEDAVYAASYTGYASASKVRAHILSSGICNVDLALSDVISILDLLRYDGKIERIGGHGGSGGTGMGGFAGAAPSDDDAGEDDDEDADADPDYAEGNDRQGQVKYRLVRDVRKPNGWTETPCSSCPVFNLCTEDGFISPAKCVYFDKWLQY